MAITDTEHHGNKPNYFLWKAVIGRTPRLPLTPPEYFGLEQAWSIILTALDFEEDFDLVLQNYIDLELKFLEIAMHSMVLSHSDLVRMRMVRLTFGRHLINLLASCRLYLDHSPHTLSRLGTSVSDVFVNKKRKAYDGEFSYRFMEALRNYSQHRGSPLHATTFNSKRVERSNEESLLQFSVFASINLDKLREDRKFKQSVLKEVSKEERLDVLSLTRIYIEKIGEMHTTMRAELAQQVNDAKSLLREALDRYEREAQETRIGVTFARSNDGSVIDAHQAIPEDVIELYEALVSQNRQVINLRKRFVSNEIIPERKVSL